VLAALRRAGVDVPGQVSVVGIDDHELSEVFDLTTVRQAVPEQGALAARMLVRAMREARRPPSEVVVPTELVVRTSTGPAR
jgi:DNA-binding LacI/PurR family transcriptional regulator